MILALTTGYLTYVTGGGSYTEPSEVKVPNCLLEHKGGGLS